MANKVDMGKRGTLIRRIGIYSVLASVVLLVLAACGTDNSTGSGTGSEQVATATAAPASTIAAPEPTMTAAPEATATAVEGMGDMTDAVPTVGAAAPEPEATAPTASGGSEVEVQATLREWAIDLSVQEVAAGKITFVVTNQGQMAHNLTILSDSATVGKTSNFRAADGAQTLEVELQPGTYTIICDLPGHAQRGQQTELVVR